MQVAHSERHRSKQRILIVDDDPDIVGTLKDRLKADGFEVATAPNGRDALAQVWGWKPDAILLDLQMPIMNGLEALRAIRLARDPVPVLVMTAVDHGLRALALSAGATGCLLKPFDYAAVKAKLEALLQGRSGRRRGHEA